MGNRNKPRRRKLREDEKKALKERILTRLWEEDYSCRLPDRYRFNFFKWFRSLMEGLSA